jgi:hypothetical protein
MEAIDAGDTVYVFGATYPYSAQCSATIGVCRLTVLYNPENSGASGNPITITCVGTCLVAAQNWNGPAVGANTNDYIKWYADIAQGHKWTMTAYSASDDNAGASEVDVTPDTGPVVFVGCTGCSIEGAEIAGGAANTYAGDNYPAIRLQGCNSCTVRNTIVTNFYTTDGTHAYAINTYDGAEGTLIEHNEFDTVDVCLAPKDTGPGTTTTIVYRFNICTNSKRALGWSISTLNNTQIHQNIFSGLYTAAAAEAFVYPTGNDMADVDIVNNVFYDGSGGDTCIWNGGFDGSRFWNNICFTAPRMIYHDSGATGPIAADLDIEHSIFYNATTVFYTGGDGSLSFADWKTAYAAQCVASPACVTTDPLFANPAGDDYRLCTEAGVPHPNCAGASPAIGLGVDVLDLDGDASTTDSIDAGVYVTGTEVIGLTTNETPATRYRLRFRIAMLLWQLAQGPLL